MAEQEDSLQEDTEDALDADVLAALNRQDEALALLERLRRAEPVAASPAGSIGGGRRDGRRWPPPEGVTLELHDGIRWHPAECLDLGVGGARLRPLPDWANGPTPARLKAGRLGSVLALSDVMWHDSHGDISGLRFEFSDHDDRELWAGLLIDALLARYAL
jgi:hypothetical protein